MIAGNINLVKRNTNTVTMAGSNSYNGNTSLEAGTLVLNSANLADAAAVLVTTGATLQLDHGQQDTVATLFIDGVQQPAGIYDSGNTSFITGSGALNVQSGPGGDPFATWAAANGLDGPPGKEAGFNDDPDGDGIANGLEWILGGNPLDGKSGALVATGATATGGLTLDFTREPNAIAQTTLAIEYNTDLGATWQSAAIGATSSGPDANGVTVTIDTNANPHEVTVNIPASNAAAGRLFGRIRAEQP